MLACKQIAAEQREGKRVVAVLSDSNDRYLEVEKYTTIECSGFMFSIRSIFNFLKSIVWEK